jgi:hypothetical protein
MRFPKSRQMKVFHQRRKTCMNYLEAIAIILAILGTLYFLDVDKLVVKIPGRRITFTIHLPWDWPRIFKYADNEYGPAKVIGKKVINDMYYFGRKYQLVSLYLMPFAIRFARPTPGR